MKEPILSLVVNYFERNYLRYNSKHSTTIKTQGFSTMLLVVVVQSNIANFKFKMVLLRNALIV